MGRIEIKDITGGDGLPAAVIEAVALSGMATAHQPSALSSQAYANQVTSNQLSAQNQVARQDAMNRLHLSILAQAVNQVQDLQPAATRSGTEVLSGGEVAQALADLKAVLGALPTR
ncbi:hypothetical protein [Paracidovorax cattleyae]|uniref:Killing trait domain-containing protein n=1 Tax=Paracidovorax cattleyae TaxID=80868 RepID=A0A1H0UQT0_9BURK|nr:hypothetical protein [Paracidovorax cattleyae]AVS75940.1 hypothetical protein C8240_19855 [Paracidovorax cattleyae]MBF9264142.1 hypothetical protein [Paracidovorax cattleyae]SDP68460.1 hypothetical protein SAMN04489708_12140 [Paracidovorax cattleyae]